MIITTANVKRNLEFKGVNLQNEFGNKDDNFYKSGEFYLRLLKMGFSILEIMDITFKSPLTIEKCILMFMASGNATNNDLQFIFENVKGLKYLQMFKRYCNSDLSLKDFCIREHISKDSFSNSINKLITIPFFKDKLQEKEDLYNLKKEKRSFSSNGLGHICSAPLIRQVSCTIHIC